MKNIQDNIDSFLDEEHSEKRLSGNVYNRALCPSRSQYPAGVDVVGFENKSERNQMIEDCINTFEML